MPDDTVSSSWNNPSVKDRLLEQEPHELAHFQLGALTRLQALVQPEHDGLDVVVRIDRVDPEQLVRGQGVGEAIEVLDRGDEDVAKAVQVQEVALHVEHA
jgi:hypothetical protein